MKTTPEILALIKVKVEEHKKEILATNCALQDIQAKSFCHGNLSLQRASEQLILKDKILFHKACAAALEDLKQDLEQ